MAIHVILPPLLFTYTEQSSHVTSRVFLTESDIRSICKLGQSNSNYRVKKEKRLVPEKRKKSRESNGEDRSGQVVEQEEIEQLKADLREDRMRIGREKEE